MKKLIYIFAFLLMLTGCKTQRITEYQVEHDTLWVLTLQQDSIVKHDSVFVHEYEKGDTVYVDKEKYSVFYRDRVKHDSVYIHKTDTITIITTIEVAKPVSTWQQVKQFCGSIFLLLLGIMAAYGAILTYLDWKNKRL